GSGSHRGARRGPLRRRARRRTRRAAPRGLTRRGLPHRCPADHGAGRHRPAAANGAAMTTDSRPRVVAAVPSGPAPVPRGGPAGPAPAGPAGTGPGRCPQPSSTWRSRPRAVADLARAFAELFCEVEAGLRPRAHLEAVMTPLLAARLAPVWVRRGPTAQVVA